jgi:CDP-glucose 4,6-dehydratase
VTGATGFLGGWLVQLLLERGGNVVALMRDDSPESMLVRDGAITRVKAVIGSIEDPDLIRRTLSAHSIDTVLHLAAQSIARVAKTNPISTFQANIAGTWNVLEAARVCNVRQVIVASSAKAYGESLRLPYTESDALEGRYPYDCSKSCADLICQCFQATYGLPVSMARCGNLFGGGDLNFTRTIPGAIQATLQGRPFTIRTDGKFVRDFLYVKDAAEAYLRMAEVLASGAPQGAYNFSLEQRWTTLECVREVVALLGRKDLEPKILNQNSLEVREQYMSCSRARTLLNWTPNYSMTQGLEETVAWYNAYFNNLEGRASTVAAVA